MGHIESLIAALAAHHPVEGAGRLLELGRRAIDLFILDADGVIAFA
jgi:hypothetical protein